MQVFIEYQFVVMIFFIGLLVGSFLNMLTYRLPIMIFRENIINVSNFLSEFFDKKRQNNLSFFEKTCSKCFHEWTSNDFALDNLQESSFNLFVPASICTHCNARIRFYDNIPLLSYVFLRGKCRVCHEKIAARYPIIEFLTAFLSALVALHFGPTVTCMLFLLFVWGLIGLSVIDYEHQILPDNLTLPLMWLGILAATFGYLNITIEDSIFGLSLGYGILWGAYWLFKIISKKEGMGYGDFKLIACLGAWLGPINVLTIILLATIIGSVVEIGFRFLKRESRLISFGPYLSISAYVVLIYGARLYEWWFMLSIILFNFPL